MHKDDAQKISLSEFLDKGIKTFESSYKETTYLDHECMNCFYYKKGRKIKAKITLDGIVFAGNTILRKCNRGFKSE